MSERRLDENLLKERPRSDVLELGLKLSTLSETGICPQIDSSRLAKARDFFQRLSSLLFSINQHGLDPEVEAALEVSMGAAVSGVLTEITRLETEVRMTGQRYPEHAFYDVMQTIQVLVGALQDIGDPLSDLAEQAVEASYEIDPILEGLDERRIVNSRLIWQKIVLQSTLDKTISDLEQVTRKYQEETAKASAIAGSLSVSDLRYKAMTEKKAEDLLVGKFEKFRKGHHVGYGIFLSGALLLMGVAVWLAFTLSTSAFKDPSIGTFSYPDLIWRITLVTGILGIATYMARQAGQHRTLATWASSICVQLQTFDAYTEQIGDADQINLLRAEFAKRVFGSQPQLKGEPDHAAGAMDLIPLIAAIAKAAKPDGTKSP